MKVQRHVTAALLPGNRNNIPCTGGRVGPRACPEAYGFSRSDRSVHPVASRYTECAIPANNIKMDLKKCEVLWSGMEEPGLGEGTMVGSLDLLLPREGGREFS